jgi:hypothetical protein
MIKVAIFCEGETEQLFCERLVGEVFGSKCAVERERLHGKAGSRYMERRYKSESRDTEYLFRMFDCGGGGGESVLSDILDLHERFIANHDYLFIIGLRDVFPLPRASIGKLRGSAARLVPAHPIAASPATVSLIFAVMEIEAWFLAEHEHFCEIDDRLTMGLIRDQLGFDPSCDDMQLRDHPAKDLDNAYRLVCRRYQINQTVRALNMERIYIELPDRYPPLKELTQLLDAIFVADQAS